MIHHAGAVTTPHREKRESRSSESLAVAAILRGENRRLARGRSRRRLRPFETDRADRPAARFGGVFGGGGERLSGGRRGGERARKAAKPSRRRGSIRLKTGVSP